MTETIHPSVGIGGGRPARLLLRLLLAKCGADILVLASFETLAREFRGEVLQPSTAHLLDALGLLPYSLAQPHATLHEGIVRLSGKSAGAFRFATMVPEYPYGSLMPQSIFFHAPGWLWPPVTEYNECRSLYGEGYTAHHTQRKGHVCQRRLAYLQPNAKEW